MVSPGTARSAFCDEEAADGLVDSAETLFRAEQQGTAEAHALAQSRRLGMEYKASLW
jgi:hypothetical protein